VSKQTPKAGCSTISIVEKINEKIKATYSAEVCEQLSDQNLMPLYLRALSTKKRFDRLRNVLNKYLSDERQIQAILQSMLIKLIPSGTKGYIRGHKFNEIVKTAILGLHLDEQRFEVAFEKQTVLMNTSELPDWYIREKDTNRVIVGMNQLDFFSGTQQQNRGRDYILNTSFNSETQKFLCVMCLGKEFKQECLSLIIYSTGFENNTLVFLPELGKLIKNFFYQPLKKKNLI